MADIITDGKTIVLEVPTIADLAAPTDTELGSGVELHPIMTPDGLVGFEPETADVDNSSLDSTFDTRLAGRASFSGTMLRLKKQDTAPDTVYDTLVRSYRTHIVVRRGIDVETAITSTDEVEVYPVECGEVRNLPPEANTTQRYEVPVKITSQPELRAVVASGV
ncbi:hypothetical protein CLV30_12582 [Haloactinopolyspora alba]|uniref:Major tail protein n=1 Tax=Haloactinopolyspora alba TaxID=648780 RepID=A0A2P8DHK8_9ACTN|nr:hypothetical protein [Haloactinopolyspora alba]PSK96700.1 hypothetical protein CLV30_12582 [Haloactinopolyspora alba]